MTELHTVELSVNGVPRAADVPARRLLSDFLRHDLGLTGTHVGCEHGVCGACTILFDGMSARSCLMLAVQADGHDLTGWQMPLALAFHGDGVAGCPW